MRFKRLDGDEVHIQGPLLIEEWPGSLVRRIVYEAREVVLWNGQATAGAEKKGSLYLPVDGDVEIKQLFGKSEKRGMKTLSFMADYDHNRDNLHYIQVTIELGLQCELMSTALRFKDDFDSAVMASYDAEEESVDEDGKLTVRPLCRCCAGINGSETRPPSPSTC